MGKLFSSSRSFFPASWSVPFLESKSLLEETSFSKAFFDLLIRLLQKRPEEFDSSLIQEAQRFLALSKPTFRTQRDPAHQLRLICALHQMRKNLQIKQKLLPNEFELRLLPSQLKLPFGKKPTLGIAILARASKVFEKLEDQHILYSALKLASNIQIVQDSFLSFQQPRDLIRSIYLELEKKDGSFFTIEEMSLLKQSLRQELQKDIDGLNLSILDLTDLEETIPSISFLSKEIENTADIPQVMISLEQAEIEDLVFRVVIVRLLKNQPSKIDDILKSLKSSFDFVCEQSSIIGYVDTLPKEASIFRFRIPKGPFLSASNSSFNLFHARHYLFSLLTQALGEIHDYNGNMFAKQLELFAQFKAHFKHIASDLLEDFFHELQQHQTQPLLPLSSLIQLFSLYLEAIDAPFPSHESFFFKTTSSHHLSFIILRARDEDLHEHIKGFMKHLVDAREVTSWISIKDPQGITLGYIHENASAEQQLALVNELEKSIEGWLEEVRSTQTLRLSSQHLPVSLDPRLGGNELSSCILKMLFEGLTRIGRDGRPHLAIAKSAIISEDEKSYTFFLRDSVWNNGDPVTAHDFVYAWKKALSPSFNSPFAHLFYEILNAKKAHQGMAPIDDIGVRAVNDKTLIIELEHPCSYFQELLAHTIFSPIHQRFDELHPDWSMQIGKNYICNGPFQLQYSDRSDSYQLSKNPAYWDEKAVKLDRILITKASARRSLEMFEQGEIDWLGRPFGGAWEPFFTENKHLSIEKSPVTSTYWCALNTQKFPFYSSKLRKALAYALDRQLIRDLISYPTLQAHSPLPFSHSQIPTKAYMPNPWELFTEALEELNLQRKDFPPLVLIHPSNEIREKIARCIAEQWKDMLDIEVHTRSYELKDLLQKMAEGDYHMACFNWRPWIDDPFYTLNALKSSAEPPCFFQWQNAEYQHILEKAQKEQDIEHKNHLLIQAEIILIQEMPIIPLFHDIQPFSRKNYVEGVFPSKTGNIDFKHVYINREIKYPSKKRKFYVN